MGRPPAHGVWLCASRPVRSTPSGRIEPWIDRRGARSGRNRKRKRKIIARLAKARIATAALLVMPGMAIAATSTATRAASFNVTSQCSVTGATVTIGTFIGNQTWGQVAAALGSIAATTRLRTQGAEYLTCGSVTCDNGSPYTLSINGTGFNSRIRMNIGGNTAMLEGFVKKIGATTIADQGGAAGSGQYVTGGGNASAMVTGAKQDVLGSAALNFNSGGANVAAATPLGATGSFSDKLTYTLNF